MSKTIVILVTTVVCLTLAGYAFFLSRGMQRSDDDSSYKAADKSVPAEPPIILDDLTGTVVHLVSEGSAKAYFPELARRFMELCPNVNVEIIAVPYLEFDSTLRTMIESNNSPDVTSHYALMGFIEMYLRGWLKNLSPFFKRLGEDPVSIGIPKTLVNIYSIGEYTYGIPVSAYVSLLAYNKDMFDEAGIPYPPTDWDDTSWTYDKMVEIAKSLTVRSDNPTLRRFGLDFQWSERSMRPIYFGAKVYSDDKSINGGRPSDCYFNTPEVIAACNKWNILINTLNVMPTDSEFRDITGLDVHDEARFATGRIGMVATGSWITSGMDELEFRAGIAAIPVGGDPDVRSVLYVDPLVLLKYSKNPEAAAAWMMFVASELSQKFMAGPDFGNPPANSRAVDEYYNSLNSIDPADLKEVYNGAIRYGQTSYNHMIDNYSMIGKVCIEEWAAFENGLEDVEAAMNRTQKRVKAILESVK